MLSLRPPSLDGRRSHPHHLLSSCEHSQAHAWVFSIPRRPGRLESSQAAFAVYAAGKDRKTHVSPVLTTTLERWNSSRMCCRTAGAVFACPPDEGASSNVHSVVFTRPDRHRRCVGRM